MAIRQASASNPDKQKKPRIQACISEDVLSQLEAFAQEKGWSVSKSVESILTEHFKALENQHQGKGEMSPSTAEDIASHIGTSDEALEKLRKVVELAKIAGVL